MTKPGDFVQIFFQCRDAWHNLQPENHPRSKHFTDFVSWAIDQLTNARRTQSPTKLREPLADLFSLVTGENDFTAYSSQNLRELLSTQANAQGFRVAFAADVGPQEDDYRVRHRLETILAEDMTFTPACLICAFFTDKGYKKQSDRSTGAFKTQTSTRFQQLVFISCIADLTSVIQPKNKRKRRRLSTTTQESVSTIPSLKSLQKDGIPQRIGCAVQNIVRGWDCFAEHLGFEDVEDMVLPYVRFTRSALNFEVIGSRIEGFPPKSQLKTITLDVELTTNREETFEEAFDRTSELDGYIRSVAKDFFSDIYEATHSSELYRGSANKECPFLQRFEKNTANYHSLPARFAEYSTAVTTAIRTQMPSRPSKRRVQSQSEGQVSTTNLVSKEVNIAVQSRGGGAGSSSGPSRRSITPLPNITDEQVKKDMELLKQAMAPYCRLYPCTFQELVETDETLSTEASIAGQVQLLLTDPPYNLRREMGSDNAEHDVLTPTDMKSVVKWANKLLRSGGHGIIFCSSQQFPIWESYFNDADIEEDQQKAVTAFMVDAMPITCFRHPSVSTGYPGRKTCSLLNSVEYALHIKKNGKLFKEEEKMVNYQTFHYVASTYPAYRNVIDHVKGLLPGEQLRAEKKNGKKTALRPEQKTLALLTELISRFSQKGDVVVDLFGGTFSTATACFSLGQHRKFVGCENDETCFRHAEDHVIRRFATVVKERITDIHLALPSIQAAVNIDHKYEGRKIRDSKWRPPGGLPPYQMIPSYLLSALASLWQKPEFFALCSERAIHNWPRLYQGLLQQVDMEMLRLVEASTNGLMISNSSIKHARAGLGVFAAKTFHRGDKICPYFGTLVYHDLTDRTSLRKTYGEGIMGINVQRFINYAMQIRTHGSQFDPVKDLMDGKKAICIVPAPFSVGGTLTTTITTRMMRIMKPTKTRHSCIVAPPTCSTVRNPSWSRISRSWNPLTVYV